MGQGLLLCVFFVISSVVAADETSCTYQKPPSARDLLVWLNNVFPGETGLLETEDVPGVLITIALNGTRLVDGLYNNPNYPSDLPLDKDSFFPAGELSEVLSAVTILEELNNANLWNELDTPIGEHLEWLQGRYRKLTMRNLLWHVSGLDTNDNAVWSHDALKRNENWEKDLRQVMIPHIIRKPNLVPTATPYDISIAAAVLERVLHKNVDDSRFESQLNQTLQRLGMPSSTARDLRFDRTGHDADGRAMALGFMVNGNAMTDAHGVPLNVPQSKLWPARGLWVKGEDFLHLTEVLSGGLSADSPLSAPVDMALFGYESRWSVLDKSHPLQALVPGLGVVFSEREVNGYTVRQLMSRHVGHGNFIFCFTESDPVPDGSDTDSHGNRVVGKPYRICLGMAMPFPASYLSDAVLDHFFDQFYKSHCGCLRRGDELPPTIGRLSASELSTPLYDTRLTHSTATAVMLPWNELQMRVMERNGAALGVRFPSRIVRGNSSTLFGAVPHDWLKGIVTEGRELLPGDRDPCLVRLRQEASPEAIEALISVPGDAPHERHQFYTTVYRNVMPIPQRKMDTMHIVVLTSTDLACRGDPAFSATCQDAMTLGRGPHHLWYEGRVRFVVSGSVALEQVSNLLRRKNSIPISVLVMVLAVVVVPLVFLFISMRRRGQARREETLCRTLVDGDAVGDVATIRSLRRQEAADYESLTDSDDSTEQYRVSDSSSSATDPGFIQSHRGRPLHFNDESWLESYAYMDNDEPTVIQGTSVSVKSVPRFISIGLPTVIAVSALIDFICYFSVYYTLVGRGDSLFPTTPAVWYGIPPGVYVVLFLPYLSALAVFISVAWVVRVVAFDTGIVSSLWLINACIGLLSNLVLLYGLHRYNVLSFML